jgi:hypothetical protein
LIHRRRNTVFNHAGEVVVARRETSLKAHLSGRSILVGALLLCCGFALGCAATVVVPLKPGSVAMKDSDHGLVFGRIHVTENGKDQPFDLKWLITKGPQGRRVLFDELPFDGLFAVQLPAGSYRLTEVRLDKAQGVWQASMPATFTVRPRECTYLGAWELDLHTEFFSAVITRRVDDEQKRDENDFHTTFGAESCPILKVPLASSLESPATLTGQAEGTQITSPP